MNRRGVRAPIGTATTDIINLGGVISSCRSTNFRYQSSGQSLRWTFRVGERTLEVMPDAGIIVDVSDAVAAVLAAGGGIGISPTFLAATYVRRGLLVPVLRDHAVERSNITALWPESRRGNPTVKAFVAYLAEIFPSPAPWDESLGLE